MNYLGKLAILGAVIAVAVPLASATTFSGMVIITDAPASNMGSNDGMNFTLASVSTSGIQPISTFSTPNLSSFSSIFGDALYSFSTSAITPAGLKLFTGTGISGSVTFFGTSFAGLVENSNNGDYSLVVNGYFADAGNNKTPGFDNIVFNTGNQVGSTAATTTGSVTEQLTATPTPEPSSLLLLGTGLAGAAGMMLRRVRLS